MPPDCHRIAFLIRYEPVAELGSASRERPRTAEREQQQAPSSLRPTEDEVPEAVRSALTRPQTAALSLMQSCAGVGASGGLRSGGGVGALGGDFGDQHGASVPSLAMLQDYAVTLHPAGRVIKLVLLSMLARLLIVSGWRLDCVWIASECVRVRLSASECPSYSHLSSHPSSGTWGDPHYIGLNGLEVLGPSGMPLRLSPTQLLAEPPAIASLPHLKGDPRTVDKLVDGVNSSYDDRHMFLAPFTPGRSNVLCIDLQRVERLGAVRLWNYAKTSTRGVRSFELLLDGSLLYKGTARPAPPRVGSALHAPTDFVQTVLFTDNEEVIRAEAAHVYTQEDLEDGLQIYDNGTKLSGSAAPRPDEIQRPSTSVVGAAPPTARRGARPTALSGRVSGPAPGVALGASSSCACGPSLTACSSSCGPALSARSSEARLRTRQASATEKH